MRLHVRISLNSPLLGFEQAFNPWLSGMVLKKESGQLAEKTNRRATTGSQTFATESKSLRNYSFKSMERYCP